MTGILSAILCWCYDLLFSVSDYVLRQWDSILGAVDATLSALPAASWVFSPIPAQYAWILGVTGAGEALTIIATALGIRFLLQSIPFVRWGS